jgi:hypothetical protein
VTPRLTPTTHFRYTCPPTAPKHSVCTRPSSLFSGNTALHWAASFAQPAMVRFLIERGAVLSVANEQGGTPLHDAAQRGHMAVVEVRPSSASASPFALSKGRPFAASLSP